MYVLTETNVLHLFCLIEVNRASDQLTPCEKYCPCTANCLVGLVGVVFVFLLKHYCVVLKKWMFYERERERE